MHAPRKRLFANKKPQGAEALGFADFYGQTENEPLRLALVERQKQQPQSIRGNHDRSFQSLNLAADSNLLSVEPPTLQDKP